MSQQERPVLDQDDLEHLYIQVKQLRLPDGHLAELHPREVLQPWILEQLPERVR